MASPRPRSDYVNGATLVRAFIANEGLQGNSVRAGRAQALQYFIDSAFWVGKAVAWPHSRPPMMEAYWLRMPISRVSSIELEPFIQANLDIWSAQVVKQHMAILDLSLKAAQEHGANVRFRLVKQLQAALAVRPDDRHAA